MAHKAKIITCVSFPAQKAANLSMYEEKPTSGPHHPLPSAEMFPFVIEIKTEASEMEKKKQFGCLLIHRIL